jgi:hypothetical protein
LDNPKAAIRKAAAARLAESLVLPLKILPPVTLLPGLSPSQDANCFSVGQGEVLTPVSARIFRALVSFNPDFPLGEFYNGSH